MVIEITDYPEYIELSKSQRLKPYKQGKKITKTIQLKIDKGEYIWNNEKLVDLQGNIIPANKNQVGKPRLKKINGQDIWSGNVNKHTRNKYKTVLNDFYYKVIENCGEKLKCLKKPLMIKFIFYYDGKQDLDNHSYIHIKVILDVIKQFIGDDTLEYINGITIQGVKSEERKLVIEIWKTKQ